MYTQYDISVLLQVIIGYNNKTDLHDITEILLKVRLNTITMTPDPWYRLYCTVEPVLSG
jgi:hypothetical protein